MNISMVILFVAVCYLGRQIGKAVFPILFTQDKIDEISNSVIRWFNKNQRT